ncbi:hypothetical protein A0H81_11232 [Grifola frondosa]|uniref:Uncharacterized protein n=1 Tax=Grifola frondosa TaxID=5627 RepID=A0A1C7LWA2_GRIFR|nr:hypothetical protein A0H81_11232 [Grifola frondosa]
MLYNRFSAVAVSIYLEPTLSNLKYRLVNARRYVNFKDTDNETRRACIRGLMHLSILLQHLQLPLDDILDWLAEMSNILIDEFCEFGQPKDNAPRLRDHSSWIVLSIQMLLRSVRHIIETPFMEPGQTVAPYPDPALLKGPWVTRVFSNTTTLPSMATTGMEIRRLVQAFLDARAKVVPRPARPRPPVVEETEESQEDYGHFDLDLNDPELLAALGGNEDSSSATANKEKEKIVCEIVNTDILPAVYRLVCKRFIDLPSHELERQSYHEADKWIDCWVGCASVVVQNGRRDWSFFLSLGPQSWERIIDPIWRRRVGLRFMYMVLQLDPSAYPAYTDRFTDVLFESLVPSRVTLEHDYVSLLFSIDGLRHPLLHDIPCELPDNTIDYKLSAEDFSEKRLDILEKMIDNLASGLGREMSGDTTLIASNQRHIGSMVCMLSTMQDTFQRFNHVTEEKLIYSSFCQQVFQVISRYPMLCSNSRLSTLIIWLRDVL